LCRECHITFHAVNFTTGAKPKRMNQMMGNACANCHVQIHGSNNLNGNLFFH
jgi:nitrate/TMAO reductase-like tetraheme cytochrome c subunit